VRAAVRAGARLAAGARRHNEAKPSGWDSILR
jgi:hypothetical protein